MALVLETGAGVSGANAYADQSFATAYLADRGGNATWDAKTSDEKDVLLVKATDHIERRFSHRFKGVKNSNANALSWPRRTLYDEEGRVLYDSNDIPTDLKKAVVEYAVASLTSSLVPATASGLEVSESSKELGPLKKTEKYATTAMAQFSSLVKPSAFTQFPAADMLIEKLLKPAGAVQLQRV